MNRPTFDDAVALCRKRDSRYEREAYSFVRDALDHAQKMLASTQPHRGRGHVNGWELLEGFRDLALRQFGPLARLVLETWGIRQTSDVGAIVFLLIEAGAFSRSETDQPSDFDNVYDFAEVFDRPFEAPPRESLRCVEPSPPRVEAAALVKKLGALRRKRAGS